MTTIDNSAAQLLIGETRGPNPEHILQIGTGFWASKTLLSAVELDLFTVLGTGSMTGHEVGKELRLNARSVADFLDSLVSLGLLDRDGDGARARYANASDTATFLDRGSPAVPRWHPRNG